MYVEKNVTAQDLPLSPLVADDASTSAATNGDSATDTTPTPTPAIVLSEGVIDNAVSALSMQDVKKEQENTSSHVGVSGRRNKRKKNIFCLYIRVSIYLLFGGHPRVLKVGCSTQLRTRISAAETFSCSADEWHYAALEAIGDCRFSKPDPQIMKEADDAVKEAIKEHWAFKEHYWYVTYM
jgi:hypothetical protein